MPSTPVTALLDALASGAARVVDLTQPLSECTPVLFLPEPFANTPGLSRRPGLQLAGFLQAVGQAFNDVLETAGAGEIERRHAGAILQRQVGAFV